MVTRPSNPSRGGGVVNRPSHPAPQPRVVTRGNTTYRYNYSRVGNNVVMNRTYVRGGVTVSRSYNGYGIGRYRYYGYVPARHFDNWYYGWAYTGWARPFAYSWGWASAPWYGYYGYYYRPYTTYYGPSYWLTDYVLADILAEQYAINAANAQAAANQAQEAAINEDIKAQLRAQVEADLRSQEAQTPVVLTGTLGDLKHIYVVSSDISATTSESSAACALTAGDLIRLTASPSADDQVASVAVVTSKQGSCAAGTQVMISIANLQSFENDFNEKLEDGMDKMKTELAGQMPGGTVASIQP